MIIKSDMKSMFKSIKYFLGLWFFPKTYDVLLVYPNYFNRGENNENLLFKPFIECCKKNNINYIVFEETDLKGSHVHHPRHLNSIPLDFISGLRILIRKFLNLCYKNSNTNDIDYTIETKIARFLRSVLLRNLDFKLCIYMPGELGIFFSEINMKAKAYEYQHGIIYDGHPAYMKTNKVAKQVKYNNSNLLVFGQGFKDLLIERDMTNYYNDNNVISIGQSPYKYNSFREKNNNKTILFSLQIAPEFTNTDMQDIIDTITSVIEANKFFLEKHKYKVIFKHHPRYNTKTCLPLELNYSCVTFADASTTLSDLLKVADLHCTFSSTTTFDAALHSIPTIFLDSKELSNNMFYDQYHYPLKKLKIIKPEDFVSLLEQLEDNQYYMECTKQVYIWANNFYTDFNEEVFMDLVKKEIR